MPQDLNANNSKVPPSDIADPNQSFSEIPEDFRHERITVWGDIVQGWYWLVFIWNMTGSFAGINSLLSSIKRTAIMLIKRLLIQLQTKQD